MIASRRIVCGHCGQINRVPADRPAAAARCGSCHMPLFAGRPIVVDEQGFNRQLAGNDIPVLIDVWAPWCGPCRAMAPMFERAAKELEPEVRVLKLNADEAPGVSSQWRITGIPTLLLWRGGHEIARQSGAMDARSIVAWTKSALAHA